MVTSRVSRAVLIGWQWRKKNQTKLKYWSLRVTEVRGRGRGGPAGVEGQGSVRLSLEESREHGEGSNWFVWWNHVTRTLQDDSGQRSICSDRWTPKHTHRWHHQVIDGQLLMKMRELTLTVRKAMLWNSLTKPPTCRPSLSSYSHGRLWTSTWETHRG